MANIAECFGIIVFIQCNGILGIELILNGAKIRKK